MKKQVQRAGAVMGLLSSLTAFADPPVVGQAPQRNSQTCTHERTAATNRYNVGLQKAQQERAIAASLRGEALGFVTKYEENGAPAERAFFRGPGPGVTEAQSAQLFEARLDGLKKEAGVESIFECPSGYSKTLNPKTHDQWNREVFQYDLPNWGEPEICKHGNKVVPPTRLKKMSFRAVPPESGSSLQRRYIAVSFCDFRNSNTSVGCVALNADLVVSNTSGGGLSGVGGSVGWRAEVQRQTDPTRAVTVTDLDGRPYSYSSLDDYLYGEHSTLFNACPAELLPQGSAVRLTAERIFDRNGNYRQTSLGDQIPNDNNIHDGTSAAGGAGVEH